ncbi:NADPH:quinone oxidoreductase family protein [Streptomyces armeniacus]|uniref:NADPH:quinone oxidoreductase family protein n=1 Tax=Streptomyces armeniacus TaxID=83291 RepID=A0A345XY54_9ACTN|nr:zinc-binding dehydrogenase [Streptomyces armeniacus]AXK36570.1 NADPH:quinone oxidoreductase family protein [Streptomyces armeniacus]
MRAVVMEEFGGPEVLRLTEVPEPDKRPAHTPLTVSRAGVNFADLHARTDSYLAPVELPYIPGNEVLGTDPDGRRVTALLSGGGYAERAQAHRRLVYPVPDDVDDDQAAGLTLQGCTAWHLLHTVLGIASKERVVVPAAAGGVGSLALQLARSAGARPIALASTEDKRRLALDLGAHAAVDSSITDRLSERIKDAAGGAVEAALEMTGGETHLEILRSLAPRGRMAVYGYAGGDPTPAAGKLLLENSLSVTGFWLPHYYGARTALADSLRELYGLVRSGDLKPLPSLTYKLADAAQAHRDLSARVTQGKLTLIT